MGNATGGSVLFNAGVAAFSTDVSIGGSSGIHGAVTVDAAASWTISGNLLAGHSGTGSLTISSGGFVDVSGLMRIGSNAGSSGAVTVEGSSSLLHVLTDLFVANAGTGTLTISSGGGAIIDGHVSIGELNGTTGLMLVTGTGSQTTIGGNLYVGKDLANGFFTVSNGGYALVYGDIEVGTGGGVGTVLVTGTDTSWDVGGTYKGETGTFTLADGAMAFVTDIQIGTGTGTHTVVVTGVNASGSNSILMAGITRCSIGETGHGVLTISEGGIVFPDDRIGHSIVNSFYISTYNR